MKPKNLKESEVFKAFFNRANLILFVLAFLVWGIFFGRSQQIHMAAGISDIANRPDGNTLTYAVGYSHLFKSIGLKTNYRRTSAMFLNYSSVDLVAIYRHSQGNFRLEPSIGVSWNDVDNEVDPLVGVRASFKIDYGVWILTDFENIAAQRNVTHWTFGIGLDVDWRKQPRKIRRFF